VYTNVNLQIFNNRAHIIHSSGWRQMFSVCVVK